MTYVNDIRGKISLNPPVVVEWKVPHISMLSKKLDICFDSPAFPYLDGTWCLRCFPSGQTHTRTGWLDLFIIRLSCNSKPTITYRLGIRRTDGGEYAVFTDTSEFDINLKGQGRIGLTKWTTLLKDKELVATRNEITIFCILRDSPFNGEDASTETSEEDFRKLEGEDEDEALVPAGIEKLSQSLKDLFVTGERHDTILEVSKEENKEEFQAHKFILVLRSSVFASMFSHDSSAEVFKINDCDPKAFKEFLSYLYSGKLECVCTENVLDLYFIADKYEVKEVKAKCVKFMKNHFSIDNFCDFTSLALKYNEEKMVKIAANYFSKNAENITATVKWSCFYKKYPDEALYFIALTHPDPN